MIKLKTEKGFTLAALMVAIGVMSIMLAIALTVWSRVAQREREEELIFRGNQYVIAIDRFYRKFNRLPLKLEELSKTRCIRKLYLDPMTKDGEWELIYYSLASLKKGSPKNRRRPTKGIAMRAIIGVISKSSEKALRPYKGKQHYNEWRFIYQVKTKATQKAKKPATKGVPLRQKKSR